MKVKCLNNQKTIVFAKEELVKYLLLTGTNINENNKEVMLGLYSDFNKLKEKDDEKEDSYTINIKKGNGFIAGSNPRSVLYGVYKYLKELGCDWVRPGADGEIIAQCDAEKVNVMLSEKASYNYRGVCIAGSVSLEHVICQIEWCAKMFYNRLFMELVDPSVFFEKWYNHTDNPKRKPEGITKEKIDEYMNIISEEIRKRGMIFQRAGHGFMCEPFGINVYEWGKTVGENFLIDNDTREMLAQINGKRGLHKNIPMITNICMSNSKARKKVVEYVVEYAKNNKDIPEIHFWLADGYDNHCECEECQKALPTDFYIMILNEIDEELTKEGIDTKIMALSYVELLWPPIRERLINPERFGIMFCPITRDNSISYKMENPYERELFLPEFKRNNIDWAMSAAENFAFIKEWQKCMPNFNNFYEFSYHFYWRGLIDYGFYNTSRNLFEDVVYLKNAGMDGMISCQLTRSYFPTGLGLYSYAKALWNRELNFEDVSKEYLKSSFGDGWEFVYKYLQTLSETSEYSENRYPNDVPPKYVKKRCGWVREFLVQTKEEREKYIGSNIVEINSWKYLNEHAEFLMYFTKLLETIEDKEYESSKSALDSLSEYLYEVEEKVENVFDIGSVFSRYPALIEKFKAE
ncbi:MAG: DUF4838 domain-containing protein [Clostridia bacterium]|nr:DUF4838 domain-containing protein [Clostridia bacterium]